MKNFKALSRNEMRNVFAGVRFIDSAACVDECSSDSDCDCNSCAGTSWGPKKYQKCGDIHCAGTNSGMKKVCGCEFL